MIPVAIILLSYNSLETTTKTCVESIFKCTTNVLFEVVIVDNLSTDGTREYLARLNQQYENIKVIFNDANYGYAKGNNIGIVSVQADYYILLNSDTIVTDHWIDKLTSFLQMHSEVGLVGPVTNYVGNEQIIHTIGTTEEEVLAEGIKWSELCCNDYFVADTLGFFCVAIPRKTIDIVGLLDEDYGLGTVEDYDYCYRVKQAGYQLACLEDVFVYHKGSVSFKSSVGDVTSLVVENISKFEQKHAAKWHSGHTVEPFIRLICNYVSFITPQNLERIRCKILNKLNAAMSLGYSDVYYDYINLYRMHSACATEELKNGKAEAELRDIKSSLTWRIATRFHSIINKALHGISIFKNLIFKESSTPSVSKPVIDFDQIELQRIIDNSPSKYIVVFMPLIDWALPLYQRPQHIACQLSKDDFLYFYCTPNCGYDQFSGFKKINESCYVTNRLDLLLNLKKKIFHLYSTDLSTKYDFVESEIAKGNAILYEYMDEIDSSISNTDIPRHVFDKHINILKNPKCLVIATADSLFQEANRYRSKNCLQITNGVEISHFSKPFDRGKIPDELAPIVSSHDVIIGYFGALASWFDFELIISIAQTRPEWGILLIGWSYDHAIDNYDLSIFPNIYIVGPIDYQKLPDYASCFSVSIIPFKINSVTKSTSPIKLFEYMALGRPIVTTDLPECRKYKSAIISYGQCDIVSKIEFALTLYGDPDYGSILMSEALSNSWESKGQVMSQALKEYFAEEKLELIDIDNAKWALMLKECQNLIIQLDARKHYIDAYVKEEIYYWSHIARWSYEDAKKCKVKTVLDIGSAYGTIALYAKKLFNCDIYCTDVHDKLISKELISQFDLIFSVNNMELDEFPEKATFDRIYLTEVLEHFNFHPLPTLRKIRELMTENGKLYLSTPDAAEWGRVDKYYKSISDIPMPDRSMQIIDDHIYQYNKDELLSLLKDAGFYVEKFDYSPGVGLRHFNIVACRSSS